MDEPSKPRDDTGPRPVEGSQPLSASVYAWISLVGVGIALLVGYALLQELPTFAQFGSFPEFYYILLVVLGLSVAAFLFGAMRSFAIATHTNVGARLELGGPVVIASMAVVGGFALTRPPEVFDFVVRLRGPADASQLGSDAHITIDLGTRRDRQPFSQQGEATIRSVPTSFRGAVVPMQFQSPRYRLTTPEDSITVYGSGVAYLDVVPLPDSTVERIARGELLTRYEAALGLVHQSPLYRSEYAFPAVQRYLANRTEANWIEVKAEALEALNQLEDAVEAALSYDSRFVVGAERLRGIISQGRVALNQPFFIYGPRGTTPRPALPDSANVARWMAQISEACENLDAELNRLIGELRS